MLVEELIKQLEKLPKDENIIVGYWRKSYFESIQQSISADEWDLVVNRSESVDWTFIGDTIDSIVDEEVEYEQ